MKETNLSGPLFPRIGFITESTYVENRLLTRIVGVGGLYLKNNAYLVKMIRIPKSKWKAVL